MHVHTCVCVYWGFWEKEFYFSFLGITKKSDVHLTNQCGVYEGTSAGQPVFITPEPQTAPWKGTLQNLHCGGIVLNLWVKPHLKTKHFPSQKWLGLFPFLFFFVSVGWGFCHSPQSSTTRFTLISSSLYEPLETRVMWGTHCHIESWMADNNDDSHLRNGTPIWKGFIHSVKS